MVMAPMLAPIGFVKTRITGRQNRQPEAGRATVSLDHFHFNGPRRHGTHGVQIYEFLRVSVSPWLIYVGVNTALSASRRRIRGRNQTLTFGLSAHDVATRCSERTCISRSTSVPVTLTFCPT